MGELEKYRDKATSAKSQIKSFDRMPDPGSLPSAPLNPVMDWNTAEK
jgi:hypothetical protein